MTNWQGLYPLWNEQQLDRKSTVTVLQAMLLEKIREVRELVMDIDAATSSMRPSGSRNNTRWARSMLDEIGVVRATASRWEVVEAADEALCKKTQQKNDPRRSGG